MTNGSLRDLIKALQFEKNDPSKSPMAFSPDDSENYPTFLLEDKSSPLNCPPTSVKTLSLGKNLKYGLCQTPILKHRSIDSPRSLARARTGTRECSTDCDDHDFWMDTLSDSPRCEPNFGDVSHKDETDDTSCRWGPVSTIHEIETRPDWDTNGHYAIDFESPRDLKGNFFASFATSPRQISSAMASHLSSGLSFSPNSHRFQMMKDKHAWIMPELAIWEVVRDVANGKWVSSKVTIWLKCLNILGLEIKRGMDDALLLAGLSFLHENEIVHLDIKPDNIFIGDDGCCKIGDFGSAVPRDRNSKNAAWAWEEGDGQYCAPEILNFSSTDVSFIQE